MNLAAKSAKLSTHPKYHFSAIVTKGPRVLSIGVNKVSAAKRFTKQRPGMHLHAEVHALLGLDKDATKGATITVCGTTAAGNLALSKPCNECMDFLETMEIKRIVYMDKGIIKELK